MYQLNSAKMYYDMADNQAIVINHMTGMYYGFNALGSYVIDQLVAGGDLEEVKKALLACEGCPADIDAQIDAFLAELVSLEILVPAERAAAAVATVPAVALEEGFELHVDAFAEAADLILADPIHDVDEGMGWPVMKS